MSAPSRYEPESPDWHLDQDASRDAAAAEILAELIADRRVMERGESILLARSMAESFRAELQDAQAGRLIAAWASTKARDCSADARLLAASVILGVLDDVMHEVIEERAAEEADARERARADQAAIDAHEDAREFA